MKKSFLILIFIFTAWLFAGQAQAASFIIEIDQPKISLEQPLTAHVYLNTAGETVDTFSGVLNFPQELLAFQDASDGNSVVNFWVQKPSSITNIFSGIIPGGYVGEKGLLFSATLTPKKVGSGELQIKDSLILHAGQELKISPALVNKFSISAKLTTPTKEVIVDDEPPEDFIPEISIEGGNTLVLFATQDKGSGISHYEVKEGNLDFIRTESPYQIKREDSRELYVKAVDLQGNEIIKKLILASAPWYVKIKNWLFVIFAICFVYIVWRIIQRRYLKNKI